MADQRLFPSIREKKLKTDLLSTDLTLKTRDGVFYTTSDGTDTALTASDFGTVAYGVFEPRTTRQEFFTWDPTNVANITTTGVTIVLRGLKPGSNYTTEVSGLKFNHPSGSTVVLMTNAPGFYNDFANKNNDETINQTWTFVNTKIPTQDSYLAPTLDAQFAPKKYVDDTAIAGAPDASTTVKGIVEIATGAELAAGTGTGGTGAVIVPAGSSFTGTSSGAADENKIITLNASGEIPAGFIDNASTSARGQIEIATAAETVAGTATGGTGAVLVPDNANFKAVASTTISNDTSKVPVTSATTGVFDQLFIDGIGTSGEALAIGDAIYLKASDSKLWKADSDADESTFSFVGICQTTAAGADVTVRFARPGQIASGLAGLTAGSYYFITGTAGTIGTTPGTRFARIGQAMSTTTLRVIEPKFVHVASNAIAGVGNTVVTTGFYPARVIVFAALDGVGGTESGSSQGDDSNTCVRNMVGNTAVASYSATAAFSVYKSGDATAELSGTITTKTATGFTIATATADTTGIVRTIAYSE